MNRKDQNDRSSKKDEKLNEDNKKANVSYEQLSAEDEKTRSREPGSQSNSSKTHNNGRGGGK